MAERRFDPDTRGRPYSQRPLSFTFWIQVYRNRARTAPRPPRGGECRSLVRPAIHARPAALYSPSRLDSKNVRSR